jgi:hypothetical protein
MLLFVCGMVYDKAVMVVALQLGAIFELVGTRWPQGLFISLLRFYDTHTRTHICVSTLFMVYALKNIIISLFLPGHLLVAVMVGLLDTLEKVKSKQMLCAECFQIHTWEAWRWYRPKVFFFCAALGTAT